MTDEEYELLTEKQRMLILDVVRLEIRLAEQDQKITRLKDLVDTVDVLRIRLDAVLGHLLEAGEE